MIKSTFIIAEIGVNHNGSIKIAKKMIDAAKRVGVDAVKFQSFTAENLALKNTPKVNYQKTNSKNKKETHFQMLKKLELSFDNQVALFKYCKKVGVEFISTPYDAKSLKFLLNLGVKKIKIASADIVDFKLHSILSNKNIEVIISTGMSTIDEINDVIKIYKNKKKITLLHCVSNYPCSYNSININVLKLFKKKFGVRIGYSDHSTDNISSIAAVTLGAKVLEKHFTLSKDMTGPDHKASCNEKELREFVKNIRACEKVLGKPIKKIQLEEKQMRLISRKSARYISDFNKGKKITFQDFNFLRPGDGIYGLKIKKIINKKLKKNVKKYQKIKLSDFK